MKTFLLPALLFCGLALADMPTAGAFGGRGAARRAARSASYAASYQYVQRPVSYGVLPAPTYAPVRTSLYQNYYAARPVAQSQVVVRSSVVQTPILRASIAQPQAAAIATPVIAAQGALAPVYSSLPPSGPPPAWLFEKTPTYHVW